MREEENSATDKANSQQLRQLSIQTATSGLTISVEMLQGVRRTAGSMVANGARGLAMVKCIVFGATIGAVSTSGLTEQLPNQVDLKTAYCIAVVEKSIARNGPYKEAGTWAAPDDLKQAMARRMEKDESDLRRLRLYLDPRKQYLDKVALKAAETSGAEDMARSGRDLDACRAKCKDATCLTNCYHESEAAARINSCDDLLFLPF